MNVTETTTNLHSPACMQMYNRYMDMSQNIKITGIVCAVFAAVSFSSTVILWTMPRFPKYCCCVNLEFVANKCKDFVGLILGIFTLVLGITCTLVAAQSLNNDNLSLANKCFDFK